MPDERLRQAERWFYRRGLPFLAEDYRSSTAVWTRASPSLAVAFVILLLLSAASFDDIAGAATGVVLVFAVGLVVAAMNRRRGRPWRALPERVSWPVLAGFVLVPGIVAFATTRAWLPTLETVLLALLVLVIAWVLTRYAILALVGWAVRYTFRGVSDLYRLTTRALPLLLLFITFLFLNTEVWQVAGSLQPENLWIVLGLFIAFGIVFILSRVPEEIVLIEATTSRDRVVAACARTPLADVVASLDGLDSPVGLGRRQRANIGLVMTVAQLVQVTLFAAVVWAFLVTLGALAVTIDVQVIWMAGAAPVEVIWWWGDGIGITRQLMRVSLFLAAFSGFYVTIYTAIDATYREQFYDRIRLDLERTLSVRRAYLALRRRP
ncbi:MAG: hypothetical protein ACYC3K_16105 [Candidatus Nanopelagicales bacterium]